MNKEGAQVPATQPQSQQAPVTQPQKTELTPSQRFTAEVQRQFAGNVGTLQLSDHQKRLIQNYFVTIDQMLHAAEEKRLKKNASVSSDQYRNLLPLTWSNVNVESLAVNVVSCARIGYDPALPNHVSMVPYKNNTTGKYDIGFLPGYRGKELMATKYGLDVPTEVIVKVVFRNDKFRPIFKDKNNPVETYEFTVSEDPFDRGDIVGGFYYHLYSEAPEKNNLMFYNIKEIEKRKPKSASIEFWGGERDVYKDNRKTGEKEKVDGWYYEMVWKTLVRAAYSAITIDSRKIDDDFIKLQQAENSAEAIPEPENETKEPISIPPGTVTVLPNEDNKKEKAGTGKRTKEESKAPSENDPEKGKEADTQQQSAQDGANQAGNVNGESNEPSRLF